MLRTIKVRVFIQDHFCGCFRTVTLARTFFKLCSLGLTQDEPMLREKVSERERES